jgi:peptide chain release factor 1
MDSKEKQLRSEYEDLDKQLQDPAVFSDKDYPKLAKRHSDLKSVIDLFDEKVKLLHDQSEAKQLLSSGDDEIKEMAESELFDLSTY